MGKLSVNTPGIDELLAQWDKEFDTRWWVYPRYLALNQATPSFDPYLTAATQDKTCLREKHLLQQAKQFASNLQDSIVREASLQKVNDKIAAFLKEFLAYINRHIPGDLMHSKLLEFEEERAIFKMIDEIDDESIIVISKVIGILQILRNPNQNLNEQLLSVIEKLLSQLSNVNDYPTYYSFISSELDKFKKNILEGLRQEASKLLNRAVLHLKIDDFLRDDFEFVSLIPNDNQKFKTFLLSTKDYSIVNEVMLHFRDSERRFSSLSSVRLKIADIHNEEIKKNLETCINSLEKYWYEQYIDLVDQFAFPPESFSDRSRIRYLSKLTNVDENRYFIALKENNDFENSQAILKYISADDFNEIRFNMAGCVDCYGNIKNKILKAKLDFFLKEVAFVTLKEYLPKDCRDIDSPKILSYLAELDKKISEDPRLNPIRSDNDYKMVMHLIDKLRDGSNKKLISYCKQKLQNMSNPDLKKYFEIIIRSFEYFILEEEKQFKAVIDSFDSEKESITCLVKKITTNPTYIYIKDNHNIDKCFRIVLALSEEKATLWSLYATNDFIGYIDSLLENIFSPPLLVSMRRLVKKIHPEAKLKDHPTELANMFIEGMPLPQLKNHPSSSDPGIVRSVINAIREFPERMTTQQPMQQGVFVEEYKVFLKSLKNKLDREGKKCKRQFVLFCGFAIPLRGKPTGVVQLEEIITQTSSGMNTIEQATYWINELHRLSQKPESRHRNNATQQFYRSVGLSVDRFKRQHHTHFTPLSPRSS